MVELSVRNLISLRDLILIRIPTFIFVTGNHQLVLHAPFPIQGSSIAQRYLSPDQTLNSLLLCSDVPLWLEELRGDEDEEFLTDGLINGFQLVPCNTKFSPAEMNNYKSATDPSCQDEVEAAIVKEIEQNNYVIVHEKPNIVSAIGAVPKPDSNDVRIIHDCSMPCGKGFNSYADHNYFKFQTLEDALKMIGPGYFLAKTDLQSAYRSVPIHPSNYSGTGLKWKFKGTLLTLDLCLVARRPLKFLIV